MKKVFLFFAGLFALAVFLVIAYVGYYYYVTEYNDNPFDYGFTAKAFSLKIMGVSYSDSVLSLNVQNTRDQVIEFTGAKVSGVDVRASELKLFPKQYGWVSFYGVPSCGVSGYLYENVAVELELGSGGKDMGTLSGVCE
ncbi:MAG: hypothetical protein V1834_04750 [Candidatus Micrarchaeota archaeon]